MPGAWRRERESSSPREMREVKSSQVHVKSSLDPLRHLLHCYLPELIFREEMAEGIQI